MKPRSLLVFYFLLLSFHAFSQEYYISNPIGMVLEKTGRTDLRFKEWVLEIEKKGSVETRVLYHNGEEDKRITKENREGNSVIKEWVNGGKFKETVYCGGRMLREITIEDGNEESRSEFIWEAETLRKVKHYKDDTLIFTDEYLVSGTGALYQMNRVFPDGRMETAGYGYNGEGIAEHWSTGSEKTSLFFYNNNNLQSIENYQNKKLVSSSNFGGGPDGKYQVDYSAESEEKVIRKYTSAGKLIEEEFTAPGKIRIVQYRYNDSELLSEKLIKEPGYREKHLYYYSSESKLQSEDIYKNNQIYKKIQYLKDGKSEETIFRNGLPLKRVMVKDDVVVEEE